MPLKSLEGCSALRAAAAGATQQPPIVAALCISLEALTAVFSGTSEEDVCAAESQPLLYLLVTLHLMFSNLLKSPLSAVAFWTVRKIFSRLLEGQMLRFFSQIVLGIPLTFQNYQFGVGLQCQQPGAVYLSCPAVVMPADQTRSYVM